MKNKKNIYITILSVALIILGLGSSLFLEEELANKTVNVITACTAIVGAVALFYQFKRDKNLNEATFLVDYSDQFYSTYDCAELMNELENCRMDPAYTIDTEKYYQKIVGYLEWLEVLSTLVNSGLLQLDKIDNVMSYRFFLITNNKQIQERELVPNREFYRSIYELYPNWAKYKKKHGLPIIFEENDLSQTEGFQELFRKK